MNLNEQKETMAAENQDTKKAVNKSRRSFAKVGVAAPVIMTLANRPAWGGVRTLCSVSGFDSAIVKEGNVFSGVVEDKEDCGENVSHGYWKKWTGLGNGHQSNQWPSPYWPAIKSGNDWLTLNNRGIKVTKTKDQLVSMERSGKKIFFDSVFGTSPVPDATLLDILDLGGSNANYRNAVGMLLNVTRDGGPIPDSVVTGLFSGATVFPVAPGISWSQTDVLNFINFYVNHGAVSASSF